MSVLRCQLTSIKALTQHVYRVELSPSAPLVFHAGQYLQVVMGENDKRPFSIASMPAEHSRIELHIGAEPGNTYAGEVMQTLQQQGEITIEAPLGVAHYRAESQRPLILLAGGTGFSYTWSILQQHLASTDSRPVVLYWGARELADLYMHEQLLQLQRLHENFSYRPVLESPPSDWQGSPGLVHHALLGDFKAQLAQFDVYVAGRFEMVRVVRDEFTQHGLPIEQLYGDALSFI
ncbi:NAD(P)H-flavin reductase [Aliidiomarina maris]|uniref:NAD(P)H-flavin reductase n=1 Tax=Aliidiomarina maris TaxID=531312 RepID=A0A327WYU7_9GAMM|nr:NAD(P)H-flavin reductase [Aliidiomarina maris]MBA3987639.1 NAD(P)H-flavin reductase [Idiomarina sp.]MCL5049025.1 NAD(P)H-flavin reductase [Bacillota bacterium]RAJ98351.1 aquacobalamin reductase/NAD(P)H-flavin reductase [Aliidiomarina maris]RUO24831.1 NAD(P)H-flavin reductase [Aliidiomarina maris]